MPETITRNISKLLLHKSNTKFYKEVNLSTDQTWIFVVVKNFKKKIWKVDYEFTIESEVDRYEGEMSLVKNEHNKSRVYLYPWSRSILVNHASSQLYFTCKSADLIFNLNRLFSHHFLGLIEDRYPLLPIEL
ncbi:hypothetical protein QVD17_15012 [Tagetes erecta]|uniref:Uncharacterized protein n=1 Tax=Tagetes erecta TaxID=13708 RepID=A0AAD8KSE1_TARER|nr:hypothetical protein QVD17_15012 [Tagetes erecta]